MYKRIDKNENRLERHKRIRKKISGTPERPRLEVVKTNAHIYANIIDDIHGHTLVSASTIKKQYAELTAKGNKEAAKMIGKAVAEKALEKGIKEVVFDRGGYIYHGRVQTLAEAAREAGLKF